MLKQIACGLPTGWTTTQSLIKRASKPLRLSDGRKRVCVVSATGDLQTDSKRKWTEWQLTSPSGDSSVESS